MAIVDALLPEFDHETATTRKLLERVPDGHFDWKPHPKSMSLGQLAGHLATMLSWGESVLNQASFNLAGDYTPPALNTREALAARSDAELMSPWRLMRGDKTMFTMPKIAVMRSFVVNHMIHHRGQLSVYLRMHDVPLPSIYGPSADEQQPFA
jgi:uncharacterized damage-inducible protein DinB